jgi:hypothetical protein
MSLALVTSSGTKMGKTCIMCAGDKEFIQGLVGMTEGKRPLGRTKCRWQAQTGLI